MDASAPAATNTAKGPSRFIAIGVAAVVLMVLGLDMSERANLIDPIPLPLTLASGAAFFAAGVWWSLRRRPPLHFGPIRRVAARVSSPIFALFIGTFLARTAVEAAAFAEISPTSTPTQAVVVGITSGKWGRYSATVSFGPATRNVDVEITSDLYDRLEPYRAPGRDCLKLSTETGRWGFRRTMLPRRFFDKPIGADRYVSCLQESGNSRSS